jgi:hypothetical protein
MGPTVDWQWLESRSMEERGLEVRMNVNTLAATATRIMESHERRGVRMSDEGRGDL